MLALAIVALVLALLLLGALLGWVSRGPIARWCTKCGAGLRCVECQPTNTATGRASVPRSKPVAATSDRPLMTRAAENRAPRISRRSI